jgi:sRNA-binding protein
MTDAINASTSRRPSRRQRDYERNRAVIALLAETFPMCFAIFQQRRRPLKVGIHGDILARLGGALIPLEVHAALGAYVSNETYRRQLVAGARRLDLDG